jgi:hypothetical protein
MKNLRFANNMNKIKIKGEKIMNTKQFWAIIAEANQKARNAPADDWEKSMIAALTEAFMQLEPADIVAWQHIFNEYQNLSYKDKLWAAAYLIDGGCSDDGFDYFRAWLTAQGEEVFMAALKSPDSLANVNAAREDRIYFERMLGITAKPYCKKVGVEYDYGYYLFDVLDEFPLTDEQESEIAASVQYGEDMSADWDFDDETHQKKYFPKLWAKFGWE